MVIPTPTGSNGLTASIGLTRPLLVFDTSGNDGLASSVSAPAAISTTTSTGSFSLFALHQYMLTLLGSLSPAQHLEHEGGPTSTAVERIRSFRFHHTERMSTPPLPDPGFRPVSSRTLQRTYHIVKAQNPDTSPRTSTTVTPLGTGQFQVQSRAADIWNDAQMVFAFAPDDAKTGMVDLVKPTTVQDLARLVPYTGLLATRALKVLRRG